MPEPTFSIGGVTFVTSKVSSWSHNERVIGPCVVVMMDGGGTEWAWCRVAEFEAAYKKATGTDGPRTITG